MVSDLLDKLDGMEERAFQEKAIKECAATVYIGIYVFYVFKTLTIYFITAGYDSVGRASGFVSRELRSTVADCGDLINVSYGDDTLS